MARRFRLHLLDGCISKDDTVQPPPLHRPPPHLNLVPVVSSSGCFRCSTPRKNLALLADTEDLSRARETPAYLWRKDEKWHVVAYDSLPAAAAASPRSKIDADGVQKGAIFPPDAAMMAERRRREFALRRDHRNKTQHPPRARFRPRASKSSPVTHGFFSSDDNNEVEKDLTGDSKIDISFGSTERVTAGESLAVVKQSDDPIADFRRSMAEMVVEKGIYEAGDLEQLLRCFLSLNSEHHHRSIVAAFTDVWEALFPATPFQGTPSPAHHLDFY